MAHGTVDFFNPSSPFTFTGWTFQNAGGQTTSRTYANELGATGNEIMNGTHGPRTSGSWTYVASATGALTIPKVGQIVSGWHVDDLSITFSRDRLKPVMTVSAHKHEDGTAHATGDCRTYSASVSLAAVAFGMPDDLGGASLKSGATVDFRSATYKLSCTHVDETGKTGQQLAGNNYDGVETLDCEFTGSATTDDYEIETGWTEQTKGTTPSNVGATTTSLSLVHHVAHDAPTSST